MFQVRVTALGRRFQSEDVVKESEHTIERLADQHYQIAEILASDAQAEIDVSALRMFECGHTFEEDLHCLDMNPNLQYTYNFSTQKH